MSERWQIAPAFLARPQPPSSSFFVLPKPNRRNSSGEAGSTLCSASASLAARLQPLLQPLARPRRQPSPRGAPFRDALAPLRFQPRTERILRAAKLLFLSMRLFLHRRPQNFMVPLLVAEFETGVLRSRFNLLAAPGEPLPPAAQPVLLLPRTPLRFRRPRAKLP